MPTTAERGYGADHVKLRKKIQKQMDAGKVFYCWRCTKVIDPSKWDLGHADEGGDMTKYNGPEHISCNRATQRHKAANVVDESREW